MDECDVAAELQQMDREGGLRVALRAAHHREQPLVIDGERCCLDCEEPIEPERLAANPGAVRCVGCQHKHERRT
jgi:phage/conjugal plasmid C-4 type zinc finger TraR family protein